MERIIVFKCVGTQEAWYSSLLVSTYTHFEWLSSIPSVAHILSGWRISQPKKQITTFEYRIHWNKKINKKANSTMPVMLCMGINFAKKNSCLVARIVPYCTASLHLLTFHILEPYPSKDMVLSLRHIISH